jgi:glycosyltransferase involved in cell wall biosynthesis
MNEKRIHFNLCRICGANMSEDPFLISVVICTLSSKRFEMTVDCIHSIFDNTYKNYEIIVVIDGNAELKENMEHKFEDTDKIRIIGNDKDEGPSMARNHGAEVAKGDIVAFIDDDAFASSDWLKYISQNFSNYPDIIVVGGKLLPIYEDGNKLPDEILWIVGCTYKGHAENRQFVRNVISANMAVKKNIFKEVNFESIFGKKDTVFTGPVKQLEDTLFCTRVNNIKNFAVLYDPDMIVYHNVPKDRLKFGYIIKRSFSEGILKAKLELANSEYVMNNTKKNETLSQEHKYLNVILASTIKNFYTLKIRDGVLLLATVLSVSIGYVGHIFKGRYLKIA